MRRLTFLLSSVALLTLNACAPVTPVNQGSVPETQPVSLNNEEYIARTNEVAKETRAICVAPANQAYFDKTPCFPVNISDRHLQDRTHITKAQKKVSERIFARQKELNRKTREIMLQSGNPDYIAKAKYSASYVMPRIENLQNDLLSGNITWGDYNRTRLAIYVDSKEITLE